LFRSIGIMMITQYLSYLIHQLQFGIWPEFCFDFHVIGYNHANMDNER
jgi:hypothetical protein